MAERCFPPPWTAELQPNYYVVRDANRQQLAYVYYENEPGRRSAAKILRGDALASNLLTNILLIALVQFVPKKSVYFESTRYGLSATNFAS